MSQCFLVLVIVGFSFCLFVVVVVVFVCFFLSSFIHKNICVSKLVQCIQFATVCVYFLYTST